MSTRHPHLVYAVTSGVTAEAFLRGQIRHMVESGWSVHVACHAGSRTIGLVKEEGAALVSLPMRRAMLAPGDLMALCLTIAWLARLRPRVVCYSTPKAALVFALAASLTRVPGRVYLLRGLRVEQERPGSWRYLVLLRLERWICARSRMVICVSEGLRQRALALGLAGPDRLSVLGSGSSNGVDSGRFTPADPAARRTVRDRWGIEAQDVVVACVGRLVRDKGIADLVEVLRLAVAARPGLGDRLTLLLIGDWDTGGPDREVKEALAAAPVRVVATGHLPDVREGLAAADLLIHPSRREGMPNVVLEAAASGLPTVTTDAPGCRDAVLHRVTGLVVRQGDRPGMTDALLLLADDPTLRERMGQAGRRWVSREFDQRSLWRRYEAVFGAVATRSAPAAERRAA